ncbi:hypothetical protein NDU88_006374 [Pleurodeles waltl]|uniref:Uncharacterized protein n=1 Tax=Pleurodeles waltl TaxID=8319 RepID=A0AAV7UMT0_PLEWA|nr:hypothetical protein NDU88_006374 [Pleurodeles waltl]
MPGNAGGDESLSPYHSATRRKESECRSSHAPPLLLRSGNAASASWPPRRQVVPVFEGGSRPTSISFLSLMQPYRCRALLSPLGSVSRRRPSLSHLGLLEARCSADPLDRLDPRFGWWPTPEAHITPVQPILVFRRLQGHPYFAS